MSKLFRIKLNSKRIIGPLKKEQVGELYIKGHITGSEECQIFPGGSWHFISEEESLKNYIKSIINKEIDSEDFFNVNDSETLVKFNPNKKISKNTEQDEYKKEQQDEIKNEKVEENSEFREFKFNTSEEHDQIDYDEIEDKYNENKKQNSVQKTRIIRRNKIDQGLEKTVIVNPKVEVNQQEDEQADEKRDEKEQEEESQNQLSEINFEEKTQFANISEFLPEIKGDAAKAEREFNEIIQQDHVDDKVEENDEEDEDDEESGENKKRIKPIVAFAFIVVIWFLLEDTSVEPKDPLTINISFPVVSEVSNSSLAREHYEKGMILYEKGDYISKLLASGEFSNSLSHQFQNNPSLGKLILTYAELFPNATNKRRASSNLFRLVKIAQPQVLTDVNIAIGTSIFYLNNEKYQTAVNTIENFLRVSDGNSRLFAVYLEALIKSGNLTQARGVADRLSEIPRKSRYVSMALSEFEKVNQNFEEAEKYISDALESDPHQIPLLIELAEFQIRNGDHRRFALIVELIDELHAGRSPVYYSKLLELRGVLNAMLGNNEKAAEYFRKALQIHESDELRTKLAALSLGGEEVVEALIIESRVLDLMKRAQRAMERREWEDAFVFSIEATDLLPTHVGAKILLSEIQIKRGFFEMAIRTLRQLVYDYPLNITINYYYGLALIESNKLHQANEHISTMDVRLHDSGEFSELLARYYERRGDLTLAVRWYEESISQNPLNDKNYFDLSQIFSRNRDYERAKNNLLEAIFLNPSNVYYRSAYAEILYDLDGASTAIGYLNEALERNLNHPKLIGDIAMFYYRNGQVRDYERYRDKLNELNTDDPSFYEFKLRTAKLRNNDDEVIKYATELTKLNPGDMETRLMLVEYLLKQNLYNRAKNVIGDILERLSTYPRANYYLAQLYLEQNNLEEAMKRAELEIENNPDVEEGFFIKGKIYETKEDYVKATEYYEKAISLNLNYIEALMGLANIKHRQNHLAEARQLYQRARRHDQNNPRIWRQLAFVHRAAGELSLAAESFETYLRLNPGASDRSQIESLINQLR